MTSYCFWYRGFLSHTKNLSWHLADCSIIVNSLKLLLVTTLDICRDEKMSSCAIPTWNMFGISQGYAVEPLNISDRLETAFWLCIKSLVLKAVDVNLSPVKILKGWGEVIGPRTGPTSDVQGYVDPDRHWLLRHQHQHQNQQQQSTSTNNSCYLGSG